MVLAGDPMVSKQCFDIYLPKLQDAANQWSIDYNICLTDAENQRNNMTLQYAPQQNSMNASASDICNQVSKCQSIVDPALDFFNCFADLVIIVFYIYFLLSDNIL